MNVLLSFKYGVPAWPDDSEHKWSMTNDPNRVHVKAHGRGDVGNIEFTVFEQAWTELNAAVRGGSDAE